ncbi:MAG: PilZ domain-containing protein [Pseudobdellovibrionaceae bacterium]
MKIVLKTGSNQVVEFRTMGIQDDFSLEGVVVGGAVKDYEKVTALFYVNGERYFITTRLRKKEGYFVLVNDTQFYRFNRRAAFRVEIPERLDVSFFISTIRNIEVNRRVPVVEFSSGGARIRWNGDKKLSKGTLIRGSLQWSKGKVLPVEAHVVHSPEVGIYGLRFVSLTTVTINRLKMLSIEIQQTVHFLKP